MNNGRPRATGTAGAVEARGYQSLAFQRRPVGSSGVTGLSLHPLYEQHQDS